MYKKIYDPFTTTDSVKFIRYLPIPTDISMSEDNTDYQAYLKWVADGNVAQPADEQGA